jgi:hypothetical protein
VTGKGREFVELVEPESAGPDPSNLGREESGWPRFDGENLPKGHISDAESINPGPRRRLLGYCGPHVMRRRVVLRWTNRL